MDPKPSESLAPTSTTSEPTDQYQVVLEKVTAQLLETSETFRKTIVYREMTALVARWATVLGIANVVALVGIYFAVSAFMQQTIGEKARTAIAEQNKLEPFFNDLLQKGFNQLSEMKSQLEKTTAASQAIKDTTAATSARAATVINDAARLEQKRREMAAKFDSLKAIADSTPVLNDANIKRVESLTKILKNSKETQEVADLRTQLDKLSMNLKQLTTSVSQLIDSISRSTSPTSPVGVSPSEYAPPYGASPYAPYGYSYTGYPSQYSYPYGQGSVPGNVGPSFDEVVRRANSVLGELQSPPPQK